MTGNRNGLVVNTRRTLATETAEREAAIAMADDMTGGIRNELEEEEASGRDLRVDEDGGVATQDTLQGAGQGEMDAHVGGDDLLIGALFLLSRRIAVSRVVFQVLPEIPSERLDVG